jgi:hypothetical protein
MRTIAEGLEYVHEGDPVAAVVSEGESDGDAAPAADE